MRVRAGRFMRALCYISRAYPEILQVGGNILQNEKAPVDTGAFHLPRTGESAAGGIVFCF